MKTIRILIDEDALQPDAGENANICNTDSFQVQGAFAPEFAMIEWTTSGSGYFVNPFEINPVYVPSPLDMLDGFVVLSLNAYSECALVTDRMILRISKPPVVSAGADQVICESDIIQLNGSLINSAFSVNWESTGNGAFSNKQTFNPTYSPSQEDIEAGEIYFVFTGVSAGSCDNSSDTLKVTIVRQPIISAGSDGWVCESDEFAVTDAFVEFTDNINWSTSGTGKFVDSKAIRPVYIPSEGDIIDGSVILTVSHIASGPCNSVSDEMVLNISKRPVLATGEAISTCFGQAKMLSNVRAQNFSSIEWSSNGLGQLQNVGTLSPTYVPAENETGIVTLTIKIAGENACFADTLTGSIDLEIYDELIVYAGEDDSVYYNTSALLGVEVEGGSGSYFFNWMPANLVFEPNSQYTETKELEVSTQFVVHVIDNETGCKSSDKVNIEVQNDAEDIVKIYNAFTPNNDGVNDIWVIEGIEKFPNNEVQIYNRWGDKIREYTNYDNKNTYWDGSYLNNNPVPDGTYYFIVSLKNVKIFTGWVHIRNER